MCAKAARLSERANERTKRASERNARVRFLASEGDGKEGKVERDGARGKEKRKGCTPGGIYSPLRETCSRTGERVSQLFAAGAAPVLGTVNEHPGHE